MADTPAADNRLRTAPSAADTPVPADIVPGHAAVADTVSADAAVVGTAVADTAPVDTVVADTAPVDTVIADAVPAGIAAPAAHTTGLLPAPLHLYFDNRSFGKYRPLKQPRI